MEATVKKMQFYLLITRRTFITFCRSGLLNYNYELDPEPERLLFVGQITTLWFMLRATLQAHPELRLFFLSIIICTGIFEAAWGMGQLYGGASTNHPLLKGDGLIFSPGPFSRLSGNRTPRMPEPGFAVSRLRQTGLVGNKDELFYLSAFTIILILIGLPGGKSHSAWPGSRNLMLLGLLSPEIRVAVIEEKGYKA